MSRAETNLDRIFMRRALELARLGKKDVAPNPMVGAVVVYDNRIIGEGWHKQYGGPHAEVNAIASVDDKKLLKEATIYVNLEPCAHHGKTPPCTDLIISFPLRRVVVANRDLNPLVAGKGIAQLQHAGVEVTTDVLCEEGWELNKRFFTFIDKKRPYVVLKWAQTADGFVARTDYTSKWISNPLSRQLVHKWRSEESVVLVGSNTVLHDDPQLNVREWSGVNPVRAVIDRNERLPKTSKVFDQTQQTICYNLVRNEELSFLHYVKLKADRFIPDLLEDLASRNLQSVLVEGGAATIALFQQLNLWDESRVFTSSTSFGKGIAAPLRQGSLLERIELDDDVLEIFANK